MSSSPSAVSLVKGFSIRAPIPDASAYVIFLPWELLDVESQPGEPDTSKLHSTIAEYFRGKARHGFFMTFDEDLIPNTNQVRISAKFITNMIEELRRLVPSPYLDFVCRITYGENNGRGVTLEKRLELGPLLTTAFYGARVGISEPQQLCITSDAQDRHCLIDIFLGWVDEPVKPKQAKICASSLMKTMLGMEESKDLTIVAANGKEVKCHRLVFEAHTGVLAAMVSSENGLKESQTGRIKMIENSEEGLSHLIKYLYGIEVSPDDKELTSYIVVELLKTAEKYELTDLKDGLVDIILRKGKDWFNPNDLVELYFHVRNLEELKKLEKYSLEIMLGLSQERIKTCDRFVELKGTDPEAAYDLIWKLLEMTQSELRSNSAVEKAGANAGNAN